jgi:hypothetical protein
MRRFISSFFLSFSSSCMAIAFQGLRVVAKLALVRNSIGADAYVADEIIRSRAGVRVRVGNTDAEGSSYEPSELQAFTPPTVLPVICSTLQVAWQWRMFSALQRYFLSCPFFAFTMASACFISVGVICTTGGSCTCCQSALVHARYPNWTRCSSLRRGLLRQVLPQCHEVAALSPPIIQSNRSVILQRLWTTGLRVSKAFPRRSRQQVCRLVSSPAMLTVQNHVG